MKTIHLVRHGEGEHNVGGWLGLQIIDAPLTENGLKQCRALCEHTANTIQSEVELIVSSPMRRTIQTTLNSFPHAVERLGGPSNIVLLPQAREVYSFPCDVGTPRDELAKYPGFAELDLSTITSDDWTRQFGEYAPDTASNAARGRYVRRWLRSRPEQNIVIVAHGNTIRCLLHGYWADELVLYANCEARSYTFVSDDSDEEAWLKEIEPEAKEGEKAPPSSGGPRL